MKKLICILVALAMTGGAAWAEEAAIISATATCSHTFVLENSIRDEHLWCIEETMASPAQFVSAECILCGAEAIVFGDEELLEPDPCEPEVCTHRLLCFVSNGLSTWMRQSDSTFEQVRLGSGRCIDCGIFATLKEVVASVSMEQIEKLIDCEHEYIVYEQTKPELERYESCGEVSHACFKYYRGICRYCETVEWVVFVGAYEQHEWVYSGKDQHLNEENRHEIFYECSVCDAQMLEAQLCSGPESGACDIVVPQAK